MEEFLAVVEAIPLRAGTLHTIRDQIMPTIPDMETQAAGRAVTWEHRLIAGPADAPDVEVTIVRPMAVTGQPRTGQPAPGVLSIHGGGMILGNRFWGGTADIIEMADRYGLVGVTPEYRLAPEHQGPAQAEDCYATLVWMAEHAVELGIDPTRIIVMGSSAGGGLSAAVALMARDRQGPFLAGQVLDCPMLDDRNDTVSAHQYDGIGAWDRNNNDTAWDAICGDMRFTDRVSPYTAPARASDLAGLPPAYIDVGAAETFRDEAVTYASRIWAVGGEAELHVWAGAFHGFRGVAPDEAVSVAAAAARDSWLRRVLRLP